MRQLIAWGAIAACLISSYAFRADAYLVTLTVAVATCIFGAMGGATIFLGDGLTWPVLLARTLSFNRDVRVSIAYLISIPTDGSQLLIRGGRITTQFQPVGGVYKTDLDETELLSRIGARTDSRFTPDAISHGDLRLRLKGRHLPRLVIWFKKGTEREFMPVREFYEELIRPGFLPAEDFPYIDCSYVGRRTFGLEFDNYSQCWQLIIGDVYVLRPNEAQRARLRELKARVQNDESSVIHFASPEEIERLGSTSGPRASFEIARTARWLSTVR